MIRYGRSVLARFWSDRGGAALVWLAIALMLGCLGSTTAVAQSPAPSPTPSPSTTRFGTRAGTAITNVAVLRYDGGDVGGTPQTVRSNESTIVVAERLDLQLDRIGQGVVVVLPEPTPVPFLLTNADNGDEAFAITATVASASATIRAIVIDVDGDGVYDPAKDTVLVDGTTPVLAPGQTLRLLAILTLSGGTGDTDDGALTIAARAVTGSGSEGDAFAGRGDGGGDAVVGATGASATLVVPIGRASAGPSLVKSQSVRATDGSSNPVRDAVITYTLDARFVGALGDARIDDPLPAGTAYVAGSLQLDGATLSDVADADAGSFDGRTVSVALTGIAANAVHNIQFKARIQ